MATIAASDPLVVITAIGAVLRGAIWPGAAGLIGPLLCWWAGAGMRGSLFIGDSSQKIGGIVSGVVFMALGLGALSASGYWVSIFSLELGGVGWGLLGTAIGFFCMTRETAEGRPTAPVQSERVERPISLAANQLISTSPIVTTDKSYDDLESSGVNIREQSKQLSDDINKVLSTDEYTKKSTELVRLFYRYFSHRSDELELDDANIIGDFGEFLEEHARYRLGFSESLLPHDKMRIAEAFIRSVIFEDDSGQIENLRSGYLTSSLR